MVKKKALLKLAAMLEADAKNTNGIRFDLVGWGEIPPGAVRLDCGTQACAVGLACLSGKFRGLSFERVHAYDNAITPVPIYKGYRAYFAVEYYFDLTGDQAQYLFSHERYPRTLRAGPKAERAVARRIRKFVTTWSTK
jgi:hypothetical protein